MALRPSVVRFFKTMFSFRGRASRSQFWLTSLLLIAAAIPLSLPFVVADILFFTGGPEHKNKLSLFSSLFLAAYILAMGAVTVRRFHDVNKSGDTVLSMSVMSAILYIVYGVASVFPSALAYLLSSPLVHLVSLFSMAGFILAVIVFYYSLIPGTVGPNPYGPDPLKKPNQDIVTHSSDTSVDTPADDPVGLSEMPEEKQEEKQPTHRMQRLLALVLTALAARLLCHGGTPFRLFGVKVGERYVFSLCSGQNFANTP